MFCGARLDNHGTGRRVIAESRQAKRASLTTTLGHTDWQHFKMDTRLNGSGYFRFHDGKHHDAGIAPVRTRKYCVIEIGRAHV